MGTFLNLCRTDYMVDEILYQAAIVSLLHDSARLARPGMVKSLDPPELTNA